MTTPFLLENKQFIVETSVVSLAELLPQDLQKTLIDKSAKIIVKDITANVFFNAHDNRASAALYTYVPKQVLDYLPDEVKKTQTPNLFQTTAENGYFVEAPLAQAVKREAKDVKDFYVVCEGRAPSQFEVTFKTEQESVTYTVLIGYAPNFYLLNADEWEKICAQSSEIEHLGKENQQYQAGIAAENKKENNSSKLGRKIGKIADKIKKEINRLEEKLNKNIQKVENKINETIEDPKTKKLLNDFDEMYKEAEQLYKEQKPNIKDLEENIKEMSKKLKDKLGVVETHQHLIGVSSAKSLHKQSKNTDFGTLVS